MAPKPPTAVTRPPISDSSLVYVPEDVVEGYQERIETGIDWTLIELGAQHHRRKAINREAIPTITFSDGLINKINRGYLKGFLDDTSCINLDQQWEQILPATLWDNEKFATDEGKILFNGINCLTDDLIKLIYKAVVTGNRDTLWSELKMAEVLRVNNEKITELDVGLLEFKKLVSLNLCGNYIMDIEPNFIPPTLRALELQANHISNINSFVESLPHHLIYIGLAKNLLTDESVDAFSRLPFNLTVLDLSDNDIYHLDPLLDALVRLPNLTSLYLVGNPCSVCATYARLILMVLPRLKWLDSRQVLPTDRSLEPYEAHPDDLRSSYFYFTVFRVMSAPQPPKPEKGATTAFHVELELPLLDVERRKFLLYRRYESLTEILAPPEEEEVEKAISTVLRPSTKALSTIKGIDVDEASSNASNVYDHLVTKSSRVINNFTTFESNKIQWAKVMNFQEPTVKIFCPDLFALRNTFRSVITVNLVYSIVYAKSGKTEKKSSHALKMPTEQRVVLASIKCTLRNPDWTQPSQHFHWDDSLGTDEAIHWGDRDLAVIQYTQAPVKVVKGKPEADPATSSRQLPPENLTCHFGFGIETIRAS
ncbi:unnamed protein product [Arctia plantaginis]|uniref:Uncharacterized protein n=1 Tax=Arctia plantaginis TaxID=874455 RepID=A0A8S0ZHW6_ARCPL|nr:unnamed protein product [Arctia plantaginis]